MAEKDAVEIDSNKDIEISELELTANRLECPVCLQSLVHAVKLPCGHIFCFLCIKGAANFSKRCAMCRQELPLGYLENPDLIELSGNVNSLYDTAFEDGQQWFYEGHNGWWQYDARTSAELETAFKRQDTRCEVLVAGFLYTIDFEIMVQYRRNDPTKRRRIKRDSITIVKKGIAGIRLAESYNEDSTSDSNEIREREDNSSLDVANVTENSISVDEITAILDNTSLNVTEDSETNDDYL